MTPTTPGTPASNRLTAGDVIPTVAVLAITAVAATFRYLPIAGPGYILTLVMIVVTFHPRHTLRSLADAIRSIDTWWEDRRWGPTPAGCCTCGTGGPYYEGNEPQVTRYLYVGACGEPSDRPDWSACSRHPLTSVEPIVDYGSDVVRTFRQTEADALAAWAALKAGAR